MPAGVSAYVALANVTLGSAASSVTFSSITGSYRDLVVVISGTSSVYQSVLVNFNNDATTTNYYFVSMLGNGSATASYSGNTIEYGTFATTQSDMQLQIMDYSATDKHKTSLTRSNMANNGTLAYATRWANTAAITSVKLYIFGGNTWQTGTSLALYGIAS